MQPDPVFGSEMSASTLTAHDAAFDAPVVICVAPNGARRGRADHPRLPITSDEIAKEARACCEAGASVLHLHVRDSDGSHTLAPASYRSAISAVEREVGDRLVVQVTTEAVGRYSPPEQIAVVRELRPRAASVALRELIPDDAALPAAAEFFEWAALERVALQFILYSREDARRLAALAAAGVLACDRPNVLFVLGRYTRGQQSDPLELLPFLDGWPRDWPWSVCAFGPAEIRCVGAAVALGGHARVGFENNLHLPDGRIASGTAELATGVASVATALGRRVATAADAKRVYGVRD